MNSSNDEDQLFTFDHAGTEKVRLQKLLRDLESAKSLDQLPGQIEQAIPKIADLIRKTTDHGFHDYKTSTLTRRIQRRMKMVKIGEVHEYVSHLQEHKDEVQALFRDLLIGVTTFFRDPEVFAFLDENIFVKLFENRDPKETIRIWCAGCSTGAEAYSLAILCRERMSHLASPPSVQIFATDIDEQALIVARTGSYSCDIEAHVSADRLKRFFVRRGDRYEVTKEIREIILFSMHNVTSDPPFSRQDLISCRNLMIYLGSLLVEKLVPLFHYALKPRGYLLLGPSENFDSHHELFRTTDATHRIAQRKETSNEIVRSLPLRKGRLTPLISSSRSSREQVNWNALRQQSVLEDFSPRSCVVDVAGKVLNTSANIGKYLKITDGDFKTDIVSMAASGLEIGLRSALRDARNTKQKVQVDNVSVHVNEEIQQVKITIVPLHLSEDCEEVFMIVFEDLGAPIERKESDDPISASMVAANKIISQLEHELEATRKELDKSIQDMEAANEELKSSNEELLSMNEELFAANEELETSKEEIYQGSVAVAKAHTVLQNLLRSTRIATVFLDNDLRISHFTPAISEIYELISSDIGRPLDRFVSSVDNMPPLPDPKTVRDDLPVEDTIVSKSGKAYIRRILSYQSHNGNFEGIVVTFHDVTELRDREAHLRRVIDNTLYFIGVLDLNGTLLEANKTAIAAAGIERGDVIGKEFSDCYWWKYGDNAVVEQLRDAMRRASLGETVRYDVDVRMAGDTRMTIDFMLSPVRSDDGRITHLIPSGVDISQRKIAEQTSMRRSNELIESQQRLSMALESARMGSYEWEPESDQVTWDDQHLALTGLPRNQMTGSDFLRIVHPDDIEQNRIAIERTIQGKGEYDTEFRIIRSDGQTRWLAAHGKIIRFEDGRPIRFVGLNWDITEQKQLEASLRSARQLAEAANESKSLFLANMSHEIRTPMTAILGFTELLEIDSNSSSSTEVSNAIKTIRSNARHLLSVINDILDMSKIEAGRMTLEKIDFSPLQIVEEVTSLLRPRAIGQGINVVLISDTLLPATIQSDPTRLRQILMNLIGNAIKFTEIGSVAVHTAFFVATNQIQFRVVDTGVGMTIEQLKIITSFVAFSQADDSTTRQFGGTGLGLRISNTLAQLLGGSIEVESIPRKGSTFTVTIPAGSIRNLVNTQHENALSAVAVNAVHVTPSSKSEVSEQALAGMKILLAEDGPDNQKLISFHLRKSGAEVTVADNGRIAAELIEKAECPFDFILMDMQMPELDGYQATRRLRNDGCGLPIVALTAHAMESDRQKCLDAGCDGYATKPISRHDLIKLIHQYRVQF